MIGIFKVIVSLLYKQMQSLSFILLSISAILSLFYGEPLNSIIIISILFAGLLLSFSQEYRAHVALKKLLRFVEAKVYVERDGKLQSIQASDLRVHDTVHFVEGSVIPVDVQVLEAKNAYVDDSERTGEAYSKWVNMGDNIYSGSIISSGKIVATVLEPFAESTLAKYKRKLESVKKLSAFNIFVNGLIRYVFIAAVIALIVSMVFLVFIMGKFNMVQYFVFATALLVGVVPEMLSLVITVVLTRESLRLSKEKIIVKRLSALESLGAIEFLLTDKTGTITENELSVKAISDSDSFWEASNSISEGNYERSDMDTAFDAALNHSAAKVKTPIKRITSFEPFNHERGYTLFTLEDGSRIARGRLDEIVELCKAQHLNTVFESAKAYEEQGMRVIGQALGHAGVWTFSGFVAFYDPIKRSAPTLLKLAHDRGIKVKVLTGDSDEVADSVAEELGLIKSLSSVVSCDKREIDKLTDEELLSAVVFTRCKPEDKLTLIDRYSKIGASAFIGDGINDALSLKRSDVGIAVENATDIAQESADIVLLNKDLSPVLKSAARGRRALRNILIYIVYTLAGNAGTFFSLLIASFIYPFLPMLPIQIFLTNLLTTIPMLLIITDNIDEYALRHNPHFEPNKIMKRVLAFGLVSSFFDLIYFQLYVNELSMSEFQTGWFLLSVLAEIALILSVRSSRFVLWAPKLSFSFAVGLAVTAVVPLFFVYTKVLSNVFEFTRVSIDILVTVLALVGVYIVANEITKIFLRARRLYNKPEKTKPVFQ
jgi:Mg2+-importing ATPase